MRSLRAETWFLHAASIAVLAFFLACGGGSPTDDQGQDDSEEGGGTNDPPVAVAEVRQEGGSTWMDAIQIPPLATVELRGTGSTDPDGSVEEFAWSVLEFPARALADPTDASQGQTVAPVHNVGSYSFELLVTDDAGATAADTVEVVTTPTENVYVELTWETEADANLEDIVGTDLDLHLLHPDGAWGEAPHDVFWFNPDPDWGVPGDASDDPSMPRADSDGAGPEVIDYSNLESGTTYRVGVHYFNDDDFGESTATTKIFVAGELEASYSRILQDGEFWEVATIEAPSLTVEEVDQLHPDGFP